VPAAAAVPTTAPPTPAAATAAGANPENPSLRHRLDAPLAVRGQFPLILPFLDLTPRPAFIAPADTLTFSLGLAYESTHAVSDDLLDLYAADDGATYDGRVSRAILEQTAGASSSGRAYFVDGETARLTLDLEWGVSGRVDVRATLPLLAHGGGFLDGPIEAYHETLGFPDGGRPPFARDQYVVGLSDAGATVFLDGATGGVGLGDFLLETRVALARPGSQTFALAATASIELPTGDPDRLDGNGSLDAGAGLIASWRLLRWSFHAGTQYAWLGPWEPAPGLAPRDRLAGFFSGTALMGERSSLVTGVVAGTGPFSRRPGGSLGDTAIEISIGIRHATRNAGVFEAALLENVLSDHNVPDVGIFLGWARQTRFHQRMNLVAPSVGTPYNPGIRNSG